MIMTALVCDESLRESNYKAYHGIASHLCKAMDIKTTDKLIRFKSDLVHFSSDLQKYRENNTDIVGMFSKSMIDAFCRAIR